MKKMRWIAVVLAFLFVVVPMQVNADDMNDMPTVADVTEPEATEPEATEPEATEPEATEPEATEPEATEPEATEPEATEPEATEPEATEPEATEPEATEPEATEPEATEPTDEPKEEKSFFEKLWAIIVHYWGVVAEWFEGVVNNVYDNMEAE